MRIALGITDSIDNVRGHSDGLCLNQSPSLLSAVMQLGDILIGTMGAERGRERKRGGGGGGQTIAGCTQSIFVNSTVAISPCWRVACLETVQCVIT